MYMKIQKIKNLILEEGYLDIYQISRLFTPLLGIKTGSIGEGRYRELNRRIQTPGNKFYYIKIKNLFKKIEYLKATHKLSEILQHQ